MGEKKVEVKFAEGVLTIKREKQEEREEKKKGYHMSERSFGSFERTFQVPEGIDADKIKAKLQEGFASSNAAEERGGAEGGKRSRSRSVDPVVRFVFDDPDLLKFEANVIAVLQVRNTATAVSISPASGDVPGPCLTFENTVTSRFITAVPCASNCCCACNLFTLRRNCSNSLRPSARWEVPGMTRR